MDDWNDFGVPPPSDPLQHQFFGDDEESSQESFFSSHGGGGGSRSGDEPRSVMFAVAPPRRPSSIENISSERTESIAVSDRRMDLDDEGDFDEIGISSDVSDFMSSTRFHGRSYTKLEVISAHQIQQLVHAFHIIVAIGVCCTLFSIIISNTMFLSVTSIGVPAKVLTEAQKMESKKLAEAAQLDNPVRVFDGAAESSAFASFRSLSLNASFVSRTAVSASSLAVEEAARRKLRCNLLCLHNTDIFLNELIEAGHPQCCVSSHPCFADVQSTCQQSLPTAVRMVNEVTPGLTPGGVQLLNLEFRKSSLNSWYRASVHIVVIISAVLVLVLGALFLIRIVKAGRKNLTQEQIFAGALLFVTFGYLCIPLSFLQLWSALGYILNDPKAFPRWFNDLETSFSILRHNTFGPFLFFYIWACVHSYRILDPSAKLGIGFYLPKLAVVLPLMVVKIVAEFALDLSTSEIPFISAITVQFNIGRFLLWQAYPRSMAYIAIISFLELVLVSVIFWQFAKTIGVLRRAPYMKHRSKQIGFRFFVYVTSVFCLTVFLCQLLLVVGRPIGENVIALGLNEVRARVTWSHCTGSVLIICGYVIICAYVNLPYNSLGPVKGWFMASDRAPSSSRWSLSSASEPSLSMSDSGSGSAAISGSMVTSSERRPRSQQPRFQVDKDYELNEEVVEPITYKKRESDDSLELKANCFTMQTHVIMFNFAWYVYYYGTPKFDTLKHEESVLPFRFTVAESISEPATDTHALVIDGLDRIVVAFKGTTSMRNLQTSLKIYHERLLSVVPTDLDGVDELERLRLIFGRSYEAAKVHKGFAVAYASVSHRVMRCIKRLIEEKSRPVFLTGHSLGGALATICSLDVWIKLRISRRQIFVSTFGSPRVGNEAFRRIYNSVIALHWRIVVDPDMVAKLPKVGYRHVGKKVMLTPHGEMFLDPNALETKLWSGNTAGFAYHRKASYLLAMRAWCVRHHRMTYTPDFWPFPVRDEDYQRFEGGFVDEDRVEMSKNTMAKKIIQMDGLVESLDDGTYANMAAVERWARLTRRALLSDKLNGTMKR